MNEFLAESVHLTARKAAERWVVRSTRTEFESSVGDIESSANTNQVLQPLHVAHGFLFYSESIMLQSTLTQINTKFFYSTTVQ